MLLMMNEMATKLGEYRAVLARIRMYCMYVAMNPALTLNPEILKPLSPLSPMNP